MREHAPENCTHSKKSSGYSNLVSRCSSSFKVFDSLSHCVQKKKCKIAYLSNYQRRANDKQFHLIKCFPNSEFHHLKCKKLCLFRCNPFLYQQNHSRILRYVLWFTRTKQIIAFIFSFIWTICDAHLYTNIFDLKCCYAQPIHKYPIFFPNFFCSIFVFLSILFSNFWMQWIITLQNCIDLIVFAKKKTQQSRIKTQIDKYENSTKEPIKPTRERQHRNGKKNLLAPTDREKHNSAVWFLCSGRQKPHSIQI